MPIASHRVTDVAPPAGSRVVGFYPKTHLSDAYAIELPPGACADPETLARFVFSRAPAWMVALMGIRDALVAGLGLKTARQLRKRAAGDANADDGRVGIFRIYERRPAEIVLGEDDKHLDFRLSVLCQPAQPASGARRLIVSTVVHCHNRLGRAYLFVIAPFHRRIVRASLRHAARIGWPRESSAI